jgi:hypothetical protein
MEQREKNEIQIIHRVKGNKIMMPKLDKPHLNALTIDKQFISVFASGDSILKIPKEEIWKMKEKSFTIFLNYAPSNFTEKEMDLLMFSDKIVANFLEEKLTTKPTYKLYSRPQAFVDKKPAKIYGWLDYMFDNNADSIFGNYTLTWLLQYLNAYFPNKTILVHGLDLVGLGKWYDNYTDADKKKRGLHYNQLAKLRECAEQINKFVLKENIFNCNLESKYDGLIKKEWKEIIKD